MDEQAPVKDEATPTAGERPDRARVRTLQLRRQVFLALGLLLCYGFFLQQPAWNEYSRYDLIRALVEEGTVQIDSFEENTGDKAFKDGHYYSDKAPGTAILGVPVYAAYLGLNHLVGIEEPPQEAAVPALAFAISGVPTALLVVLLVRFLIPYAGEPWALCMGVALGLGSILFPFATMFFGHAASAFFLFAAFYALWSARRRGTGSWRVVLAGFLGGFGVITEFSVVLGVAVLAVYALLAGPRVGQFARPFLRHLDLRTATLFVLGGIVPALLLFGHNTLAFGSPLSLGYSNLQNGGFASGMSQGILGVTVPKLAVLGDLTIGPRGLLRLTPWFVLAPLGLVALRRRAVRAEVVVAASICVGFLLFNAGYYLPFGGWTPGPRFLAPALPFAAVLVGLAPRRIRPVTLLLVVYSVVIMFVATSTRPNAQELYEDPLIQLWIPRLLSGNLADSLAWHRWGFSGLEPLLLLAIGLVIALAGLLATRSRDRASNVVAITSAVLLGVFVVACAVPAPVPASVWLPGARDPASPPALAVPASGSYRMTANGEDKMVMWAQFENAGGAVDGTKIRFRVAPLGDPGNVREMWYADIPWSAGKRDQSTLGWEIDEGVDPAAYVYQIQVVGPDDEVLATSGSFRPFGS